MKFLEAGVYMTILRTYYYLESTGRENSFERFPFLRVLSERLTEEAVEAWKKCTDKQAVPYYELLKAVGDGMENDHVLQTVLDLCIAVMHVPEFGAYLNYYTGSYVTMQLAYELEGIFYPDYADVVQKLKRLQCICYVDWKKSPLQYVGLEADNRLLGYLMGNNEMDAVLRGRAEWFLKETPLHPMYIRQYLAEEGMKYMGSSGTVLQIFGSGGRRFLAKHIAKLSGQNMLFVDAGRFPAALQEEFDRLFMHLAREVFLRKGAVCIYGITEDLLKELQITAAGFFEQTVLAFCEKKIPVIFCTEKKIHFEGTHKTEMLCLELSGTTREERENVWKGFQELYDLKIDCIRYSIRYRLSASEIAKAVELWRHTGGAGKDELRFSRICYDILCSGEANDIGEVIDPAVGFSDIKVPRQIRETLGQICCGMTEGYRIYEEWNLKQQYPYGRAVTVLLTGPPGTGKTMTAHVIAKELGIPLYQVDLSHVMDKYIGETEKHLEQVFAFAEKTNMVLFFDEADSLFGRRGEVTEGKDRYANMEVSYILQRIEQFDGIAVLATNFYNNIDKAFLRRMKYVLKYQAPDQTIRRSIWESCFPPELPHEELDIEFLAGQFDFTGGMIKNAVQNACVMAVYERERLHMGHLLKAVRAEYEKMERTATRELWGEYGDLMDESMY